MRHSPKVLTKQEIMMELWGDEEPESDALRRAIFIICVRWCDKPFEQKLIHTISGVGLKIALEALKLSSGNLCLKYTTTISPVVIARSTS